MIQGIRDLPPSRRDKKQIVAHLDPDLIEAVHRRRRARELTIQEILGDAVNRAVSQYGRQPFLKVGRDRLVKRNRALAQVQTADNSPDCRTGKRRIAAWFDRKSVENVADFAREVGTRIEHLVDLGLRLTISEHEMAEALLPLPEQLKAA